MINEFRRRKILYLILIIVIVSVFTLSIAYAALGAVLAISGSSEVEASNWDIYLDNVEVKTGSVSANAPAISGNSTLAFDIDLNLPGDFYEFTVDVVNEGTIDAMIDSVVKTPELTSQQSKYIKYEVSYQNGESISTNQTLKSGTSTPIKVRVEYRKDIVASDLPSSVTELNLKLTLVYVQSDGSGSSILNNGRLINVVSGDGTNIGDEVCIKEECFYVISSTDNAITMLSKYNLYVGYEFFGNNNYKLLSNPTGKQDSSAIGYYESFSDINYIGLVDFSSSNYWVTGGFNKEELKNEYGSSFPTYVYDNNSFIYSYVEYYKTYLKSLGVTASEARLISYEELIELGCIAEENTCGYTFDWVYSTSYWSGSAAYEYGLWSVSTDSLFYEADYLWKDCWGIRPVITISRDYL